VERTTHGLLELVTCDIHQILAKKLCYSCDSCRVVTLQSFLKHHFCNWSITVFLLVVPEEEQSSTDNATALPSIIRLLFDQRLCERLFHQQYSFPPVWHRCQIRNPLHRVFSELALRYQMQEHWTFASTIPLLSRAGWLSRWCSVMPSQDVLIYLFRSQLQFVVYQWVQCSNALRAKVRTVGNLFCRARAKPFWYWGRLEHQCQM